MVNDQSQLTRHVLRKKKDFKFQCIAYISTIRDSILMVKRAESSQSIHLLFSHL